MTSNNVVGSLTELWDQRIADSDKIKSLFKPLWDEASIFYMGSKRLSMPPGAEWMDPRIMNEFMLLTEQTIPQVVLGIMGDETSYKVRTPTLLGQKTGKRVKRMLDESMRKQNFAENLLEPIRRAYIFGEMPIKRVWHRQFGDRSRPVFDASGQPVAFRTDQVLEFNGPKNFYPELSRIWKSPELDGMGKHLWIVESMPMDIDEMNEFNKRFKDSTGSDFYQNLNQLTRKNFSASGTTEVRQYGQLGTLHNYNSDTSQFTGVADSQLNGMNSHEFRQCWGRVSESIMKYGDTQKRMQLFGPGGILVRDVPAPTYNHEHPYQFHPLLQLGREMYGRSPIHWAMTEIEQMSEFRNLRLADAWTQLLGTYVADRSAGFDENNFLLEPGGIWMYGSEDTDPIDARKVIAPMLRNPPSQAAFAEVSIMADHIRSLTGADMNTQGESFGARTTLGEVANIDNKHGARGRLMTTLFSIAVERNTLEENFKMHQAFQIEPLAFYEEDGTITEIRSDDLQLDVDVVMDTAEFGPLNGQEIQAIQAGLNMFMGDPETRALHNMPAIVEEFYNSAGLKNVETLLNTPEALASRGIDLEALRAIAVRRAAESSDGSIGSEPRPPAEAPPEESRPGNLSAPS